MSASATIVSFLLIESCRLEPFPKDTILLTTELLKNFNRDHFRNEIASQNWDVLDNFKTQMTCGVSGKLSS